MSQRIHRFVLIAALWPAAALCAAADTLHVPAQFANLRHALNAAHDGDEIVVADGVYTGGKNKNLDFHGKRVRLRSENGPRACIIDCEQVGRAFFFHSGETPDSVLEGFTIRNGYALRGAGILCLGSSPTVRDCIITDNVAHPGYHSGGAGMANQHGSSPVVTHCSFINNRQVQHSDQATGGGGMNNAYDSDPTVTDCLFIGNSAQQGGGMLNALDCDPVITNCRFSGNRSVRFGGGLLCASQCNVDLRHCVFDHNYSEMESGGLGSYDECSIVVIDCAFVSNGAGMMGGGLLSVDGGHATVLNCSFLDNFTTPPTLSGGGGGMVSAGGTSLVCNTLFSGNNGGNGEAGAFGGGGPGTYNELVNCTLTDNIAAGGGGLCVVNGAAVKVTNCVLWNNTATDHGSEIAMIAFGDPPLPTIVTASNCTFHFGSSAVYMEHPSFTLNWSPTNLVADPLFSNAAGGDFTLLAGSPCIDTGNDAALPPDTFDLDGDGDLLEPLPIDLAGSPRVLGYPPRVDLGAYERTP